MAIGKEEIKVFWVADDLLVYVENPDKSTTTTITTTKWEKNLKMNRYVCMYN